MSRPEIAIWPSRMPAVAISSAVIGDFQLPYGAATTGACRARSRNMNRYRLSTFARAHGVLRRNFRLDAMLGSLVKLRMRMRWPRPCQPKRRNQFVEHPLEGDAMQRVAGCHCSFQKMGG